MLTDGNMWKTLQLPWHFEALIWKEVSHVDPEGEKPPCFANVPPLTWTVIAPGTAVWKWWLLRGRSGGWDKKKKKATQDGKMVKVTEVLTKRWAAVSLCITRDVGPRGSSFEGALHSVRAIANGSFTVAGVYPLPSVFILHILLREMPQIKMTWCVIPAPPAGPCVVCGWQCWANRSETGRGQERGLPKEDGAVLFAQYQLYRSKGHSELRIGALVSQDS